MNHGQHTSVAKEEKSRQRFRGWVETHGVCVWCSEPFTYKRHYGATRKTCSRRCAGRLHNAQVVARRHYLTGTVHKLCPSVVRCWMCAGDFRGGKPLSKEELPFSPEGLDVRAQGSRG